MITRLVAAFALALTAGSPALAAYCGCDKPPPAPNVSVRPDFSYPGATIILFSENFVNGRRYTVNFYRFQLSAALHLYPRLDGSISTVGVQARDQGDFDYAHPTATLPLRKQIRAKLPKKLHYGPARIEVIDPQHPENPVLVISENEFTVIGRPIELDEHMHNESFSYETGMSRDGHIFFAFDMSDVRDETLIDARFMESIIPLSGASITGWNVQGFNVGTPASLPDDPKFGWRLLDDSGHDASTQGNAHRISYWRHEFNTWWDIHEEGGGKEEVNNPIDHDYWHQDGTPHFDQDHIIVAVDVSAVDPALLLRGTKLNLIRIQVSTQESSNPYANDPNPANAGTSTTSTTTVATSTSITLPTLFPFRLGH